MQPQAGWELLDSGGGRKLERFGDVLLDRPAAQAFWPREEGAPWSEARAGFHRGSRGDGRWRVRGEPLEEGWSAGVEGLNLEIRATGFGNVGLFPEHSVHFAWMRELLGAVRSPDVLNLFAYTGAASIACALAGARVTHVDSAGAVNGWARLNAERNGVPGGSLRFFTDDALKLARRELRRGHRYRGILLDPPSFGRGPRGEVFKLEDHLPELLASCLELLADDALFLLLTAHSPGVTPAVLRALLREPDGEIESGEMLLAGGGPPLPCGAYARWTPR
ncbi:MAG: class I SAM-dependent methyltransferase [Polyangia bacterium]